jgi:hypothetical protein
VLTAEGRSVMAALRPYLACRILGVLPLTSLHGVWSSLAAESAEHGSVASMLAVVLMELIVTRNVPLTTLIGLATTSATRSLVPRATGGAVSENFDEIGLLLRGFDASAL